MPAIGQTDLPEYCQKPTLILGCGNLLFGDDGFGCALVEYVEFHQCVPDDVCILDVGTGVRNLLFTLCLSPARPSRLLIVDAVDAGRLPGELFELDPADIPPIKLDDFSMHQIPTSNLLRELQQSCAVEVRILACQTGALPKEVSPGLSPPVEAALPFAAEWLAREYWPNHDHTSRMLSDESRNNEPVSLVSCRKGDAACQKSGSCDN